MQAITMCLKEQEINADYTGRILGGGLMFAM